MEFMVWVTSVRQYLHFSTTYCRYYRLANDGKSYLIIIAIFAILMFIFGDKMNQK